MKKYFLILLVGINLMLNANQWESYWITAINEYQEKNYVASEHNFNMTIDLLENEHNLEYPSIYLDRARLFLHVDKYEEALADLDKALFSEKLKHIDRVKAVSARVAAKGKMGITEGYEEDIKFLVKNFEIQVENTENFYIVRNIPKNENFGQHLANFFIGAGICKGKEDIQILSSDICVINKKFSSKQFDNSIQKHCVTENMNIDKRVGRDLRNIEGCKLFCDANAQAAVIGWCINYPELCVVSSCNKAVLEINGNCHTCCQNGFSQDICVAPFGDIVAVMQKYLPSTCGIRY